MMRSRLPTRYPVHRSGLVKTLMIAVVAALVFGCAGAEIRPEQRIPLPADSPYESTVKTTDYSMAYQLVYEPAASGGGKLVLKGKLIPRRGLDSFSLWINFLDAEGKTIGSKSIYSPGAGRGAARSDLEKTVDVPPGTVSVAFSHNAREKRPIILD